jgi:hypothetical protein
MTVIDHYFWRYLAIHRTAIQKQAQEYYFENHGIVLEHSIDL